MSLLFLAVSKINNIQVSFEAYLISKRYASVSFEVGNSYDRDRGDEVNKVAITKWLLKQWKHCLYHIEKEELIPVCEVYTGDWNMRDRFKIFKKMGFTPVYGIGMVYGGNTGVEEALNLPTPVFNSSEYYYSFFEKDSCLYEDFFDKENAEYKGLLFNSSLTGEFSVRGKVWLIRWLGVDEVYKYTPLN